MNACSGRISYAYTIAAGAASTAGARVTPFGIKTVLISSTQPLWFTYGPAPQVAAVGSGTYLPAGWLLNLEVAQGDTFAAIAVSTAGTLSISEMTR